MSLTQNKNPTRKYRSVSRLTQGSERPSKKDVHKAQAVGASFFSLFLGFLLIFSALYGLTWLPVFQIQNIELLGLNRTVQSDLLETTNSQLSEISWPLWSSKSIFLFDRGGLETKLLENHTFIQSISIQRKLPNTIVLQVVERFPSFRICDTDSCYLLANDGNILDDEAETNLIRIQTTKELTQGQELYSERIMQWLTNLVNLYANGLELGVDFIDIVLEGESGILEVALITPQGYPIRLDFETDIYSQAKVLDAVISQDNLLAQKDKLEYIDLRVSNRVYYRFISAKETPEAPKDLNID